MITDRVLDVLLVMTVMVMMMSESGMRSVKADDSRPCSWFDFKCANNRCIGNSFVCNFDNDCGDNSDEDNCGDYSCSPTDFRCANKRCVPHAYICNGHDDCGDMSDEEGCEGLRPCSWFDFVCANKACVLMEKVGDGLDDCGDNSDELIDVLEFRRIHDTCLHLDLMCSDENCFSVGIVCDGINNCTDDSDDDNCNHTRNKYRAGKLFDFICTNKRLVPIGSVGDCGDDSDEQRFSQCSHFDYACTNQKCVPVDSVCDGKDDCGDSSDEHGCKINCTRCLDLSDCETRRHCEKCQPGWRSPDCIQACGPDDNKSCQHGCGDRCDPLAQPLIPDIGEAKLCDAGFYGSNCQPCNPGCDDVCDAVTGYCNCRQWWVGDQCASEIKAITLPADAPRVVWVNDSSIHLTWEGIPPVPASLGIHYQYAIVYRVLSANTLKGWENASFILEHFHSTTLTHLASYTKYELKIRSYRVQEGIGEEMGESDGLNVTTTCGSPSPPRDIVAQSLRKETSMNVTVTWKPPLVTGCDDIDHYTIQYRQTSALDDQWTVDDQLSSSSTSYTLTDLDVVNYVLRVVVTNNGNFSNYAFVPFSSVQLGRVDNARPDVQDTTDVPLFLLYVSGSVVSLIAIVTLILVTVICVLIRRNKRLRRQVTRQGTEPVYEEIASRSSRVQVQATVTGPSPLMSQGNVHARQPLLLVRGQFNLAECGYLHTCPQAPWSPENIMPDYLQPSSCRNDVLGNETRMAHSVIIETETEVDSCDATTQRGSGAVGPTSDGDEVDGRGAAMGAEGAGATGVSPGPGESSSYYDRPVQSNQEGPASGSYFRPTPVDLDPVNVEDTSSPYEKLPLPDYEMPITSVPCYQSLQLPSLEDPDG